MDDDLTVCRTGELIDNQAHALPERLNRSSPLRCQGGLEHSVCYRKLSGTCAETIKPPLFSCRRSTPDSSLLVPLVRGADAWLYVPCPYNHPNVARCAGVAAIDHCRKASR